MYVCNFRDPSGFVLSRKLLLICRYSGALLRRIDGGGYGDDETRRDGVLSLPFFSFPTTDSILLLYFMRLICFCYYFLCIYLYIVQIEQHV